MNQKRKQRLMIVAFLTIGFSIVVGLAMYALSENINLFYNPTQIADGEAPVGAKIRAGGMVKEGSVGRDEGSLAVKFVLTDFSSEVDVEYTGILPDLFREGQGIVALGRINENRVLIAEEVLAKHDENYMPPEVAEALEKSGHSVYGEKIDDESAPSSENSYSGGY
ncbi:cytochrome c biogenesis protein CcmE [Oleiphilus sp. HI0071]|uniref:cytochrome c maturation protein CcmE n=1 Tax=unclassified Oleiphilus TaxID=2631174 RepID=UPI0007C30802|nr:MULTISPECIES: cytochrome c maturation protein CcmE [unclassified Oleiphilus]KZY61249.1 cytochrome c biogenesis protein CcmE [Oleiphilus sp. HI0065]KZY81898.1 cytochrome c biogenesis protein CcmE [Oleiphilus sp. HI0071]KZY91670.1 cytochrome c biogenesis protein CcmE [Oleiphilus sp. HI0073]KZZ39944.1 cytochrome c biogenesis protein CcmE [Oleiphilus sp. HI0118]KZZ61863.1 cytochrome c biogenesis protein CcmE [Oleiphilus sp. HI0122]KZZ65714.1 cytochrome c biogenesis protein CcmE [Oleiphilus sp.